MKIIKSDTGFLLYKKIFRILFARQARLVLWQNNASAGRKVSLSKLNSFNMKSGKFTCTMDAGSQLQNSLPLYCYAKSGPLIFKCTIEELGKTFLSLTMPDEIKVLDEGDVAPIENLFGDLLPDFRDAIKFTSSIDFELDQHDEDTEPEKFEYTENDLEELNEKIRNHKEGDESLLVKGQKRGPLWETKIPEGSKEEESTFKISGNREDIGDSIIKVKAKTSAGEKENQAMRVKRLGPPPANKLEKASDRFKFFSASPEAKAATFKVKGSGPSQEANVVKAKAMSQRSNRDRDFLKKEFDPTSSLEAEEKMFASKRESPRARPKKDKWVKVQRKGDSQIHFLRLFDLSRGGMGFIALGDQDFPKGSDIHVLGFDEFDLDDPIVGKVMSLRPLDDTQIEFKIGVKFSEGQD